MTINKLPHPGSTACLTAALALTGLSVHGAGFDLPDQDAFVIARGMAFVATADNPSAIYYNPAGISQLSGFNIRGGIYGIYLDPSFTPPSSSSIKGTFDNQDTLHAVPQFFTTYTLKDSPLTVGLGVYSPFGLGLRWPQNAGFRTVGTQSQVTCIVANPVAALKLSDSFSLGAGVTVNYAGIDLRQGLFSPNQPTDEFRFDGDGWAVGYNLGALWHVCETVSLGATFRSGFSADLHGHTSAYNHAPPLTFSDRTSAHGDFNFPLKAIFGVSYRPTPQWNFEFDADYTDWNAEGTVMLHQSTPLLGQTDMPVTLDWQSSWYYEFGATRYLANGWHVSAGYIYNENSVPNAHATPLVADLDRHFFSIGTGVKGKRFDFDIAYQFGYGPTRTVTGSTPSAIGQTADGNYDFISHAVAVSVGMHF